MIPRTSRLSRRVALKVRLARRHMFLGAKTCMGGEQIGRGLPVCGDRITSPNTLTSRARSAPEARLCEAMRERMYTYSMRSNYNSRPYHEVYQRRGGGGQSTTIHFGGGGGGGGGRGGAGVYWPDISRR
jgi:hypothetical protein